MDDQTTANDECGICLEPITAAVTLPCNHKFCAVCLDGWKSKFGSSLKKERNKSCPLCREKIPPSKDMIIQLEFHRAQKRELEADGDKSSKDYIRQVRFIQKLEEEIDTYNGKGLDYDGCIELPKYIYDAMMNKDLKSIMKWLGYPVDKKKLSAKYPGLVNSTLVHLTIYTTNSGLLSILLQFMG